ncbi:MAG: hypothetical protein RL015_1638 [Verrucomicrobiota bacterium]
MPLLPLHQAHDPRALLRRWRAVAGQTGLKIRTLTEVAGEKILYLESPPWQENGGTLYLSSGVHGDEAAAAWGLLIWVERNLEVLRKGRFLIFPCLNPHGLRHNTRTDHRGHDLNRCFHLDDDPVCGPWRQLIQQQPLRLGLCLHEDYDAQGCYVYELGPKARAMSQRIMQNAKLRIPADQRTSIDGSRAQDGIIRRSTLPQHLPGMPEAIVLWQLGCAVTLTFETPSEFGFDERVESQVAFIESTLTMLNQP